MPPRLSIVMPAYNQARFMRQAIESIQCQTFKDWELIIVDDGSTDPTPEIAASYLKDPRIKYFRKENGGTGSALNEGFKHATGAYETWFASDNVLYAHALDRLVWALDNLPADYVYASCDLYTMDTLGRHIVKIHHLSKEVNQEWSVEKLKSHYFLGMVWIWRRELREKAGEFQLEPCEDYYFVFQMVAAGARFHFLNENLGWFRRHALSMTLKIIKEGNSKGDAHYYSKIAQSKGLALLEKAGVPC